MNLHLNLTKVDFQLIRVFQFGPKCVHPCGELCFRFLFEQSELWPLMRVSSPHHLINPWVCLCLLFVSLPFRPTNSTCCLASISSSITRVPFSILTKPSSELELHQAKSRGSCCQFNLS